MSPPYENQEDAGTQHEVPPHIRELQSLCAIPRTPSVPVQFLTMMIKNLRQKSRTRMGTLLEILLPFIFVLGLVAIWAATYSGNVATTQYVTNNNGTNLFVNPTYGIVYDTLCTKGTKVGAIRQCGASENVTCPDPYALPSNRIIQNGTTGTPVMGLCYNLTAFGLLPAWLNFEAPRYLPSLDEMIMMQWIDQMTVPQKGIFAKETTAVALSNSGLLYFVPQIPEVYQFMAYLNATSTLFPYVNGSVFADVDTARSYVSSAANADTTWGIMQFNQIDSNNFDLTILMNRTGIPPTDKVQAVGNGIGSFSTGLYIVSGFLTLQDVANRFYESQIIGVPEPWPLIEIPMPFLGYNTSAFLVIVGALASLFLVFGYIYPVSQLVKRIVAEKEDRVREAMMIMGLSTGAFYTSWVVTYFLLQVATSLICAGVLKGTIFPKSDFAIIWGLYFTFGLSIVTFSSMMSSFFSKSRIAALAAPVIFFVCAIPSFALPDTTPAGTLIVISLLSPTAFANGMNVLVNQEIEGGMTQATINQSFNGYPMSISIFMMVLDTVIYMLLTLYLDAVLPSEWGTRLHPCFCFVNPCRWLSRKMRPADPHNLEGVPDGRDPDGAYEGATPGLKPSVELRGMRKEFSLPNGGRMCAVDNLTFNMYENQVFCLLGHNGAGKTTAMNLMTGMLELDAGECYFHGNSVTHDLELVRQEVGYCPQHNILWPELTCREHLYFFARLKGLDGEQRERAVEAVLKAVDLVDKADKFTAELSGGQKRKLSVAIAFVGGSRVVFLDEPSAGMDVEARRHTWDLIKYMTPGRTIVLTTHYMEEADLLGHTIAIMSKGRLKCMGSAVFLKSRLGVGYNLTVTCNHGTTDTSSIVQTVRRYVPEAAVLSDAAGEVCLRLPIEAVPQFPALLGHFEANAEAMGVRGHGISMTTLEEVFIKIGRDEELRDAQQQHTPRENAEREMLTDAHGVAVTKEMLWTPEVASAKATPLGQAKALMTKRFHYARRDTRTIVMQLVLPVVCILFAMLLTLIKYGQAPELLIGPSMYSEVVTSAYANCPPGWGMYTVNDTISVNAGPLDAIEMSQYLLNTYNTHPGYRVGSYVCTDNTVLPERPDTVFFTNTSTFEHSAPEALWEVHSDYIRFGAKRLIQTSITSWPLPLTPQESATKAALQTLFIALFIMIPLTFVPSTFVAFVVKERETRALQLQQTAGLKFMVYWVSNYVFDLVSFLITALLVIIVFAIFGRSEYVGSGELFIATLLLFVIYATSGVSSSYIMSFMFTSHSTAQNIVMLFNFICGFMLVLLAYILSIISSTQSAGDTIVYIFRLVPSYCLGEGILNLANRQLQAAYAPAPGPFDMSVLGWPLLYLGLEAPIFFAITLYIDSPLRRSQQHQLLSEEGHAPEPIEDEDEDVQVERAEVESGKRDDDVVVIKNLRKVYRGRKEVVAVRNLSVAVRRGEVFGFLGTNGAGKTTTISILCGEHMPTRGRGWIGGHDVVSEATAARALIGYCPQFDATHDLLTAEEHLALYAGLHGLPSPLKDDVIERLIHVCGLQEHRTKESRSLSGGNRRKLSVAIALVGAPEVVFLDEPSAGMDPMARRSLFDVIEQIARHSSVVLTTHHLEEVEALSNRVGIMVNGELRCVGPLQHLKTKFGSGFEMTMRVSREAQVPAAINFVLGNLETARIQEERGTKLTVALPQTTKLSAVFQLVETNKVSLGITDYSVLQTSLESVFLRVSTDAHAEE